MSTAAKLEALETKRNQLNARIQALRARESQKTRARDTRRKIVIGSAALKLVESGKLKFDDLTSQLSARDRKLFEEIPNATTIAAMQETEFETVTIAQAAGLEP